MPVELPEGFDEGYLSDIEDQEEPQVTAPPAVRPPYQWHDEYAGPGAPRLESPETPQEFQTILKGPQALSHAWEDVNTPFIPLSRFTPSAQTVQDAFDSLASSSPELTEEEAQRLDEARGEPGAAAKIVSGTLGGVNRFTESLTSPLSIATLGVGALPKVVGRLASGAFALQMANQVGPASARLADAIESGDPEAISGAATDLAALGTGAGGAAFHGVAPGRVMLPESMRALGETAPDLPQREGANAIQRETTPILRNVPEQPGERPGQVSGQELSEQGPSGNLPSGDAGGAPPAETAGAGEIPLAQEAFSRAEGEAPLLPQFQGKSVAEAVEGYNDVTNEQLKDYQGKWGNGATGFAHDLGSRARTPEDVAALRKLAEESGKRGTEFMKKGDLEGAMAELGRQPAEAYEFATGVKLDGTPKWETFEKRNPDYRPPVPDEKYLKAKGLTAEAGGERALTETSPLDPKEFTATDAEGNVVADIPKLQKALEEGKIKGGEAANQLLSHLLKGDEAHPLAGIQIKDLAPEELKALTGGQTAYRGRFSLPRGERAGRVEVLTRNDAGQPITHADFVKTLNHELTHNAVTSKYDSAPEEVKGDLQKLFDHAKAQAAGTEFEGHNAMRDVHEFLSEAASSPKIQTWLTKMAYEGAGKAKNAWGKFVELVHKILRAPANLPLTALDEAMRLSGELEGVRREAKFSDESKFSPAEPTPEQEKAFDDQQLGIIHPAFRSTLEFLQGLPGALKTAGAQLAGKSAPKTSAASTESGNTLVRYASAKIASPLVAKSMATDVLGSHYKDPVFGQRLGAVLVEDRLRAIKDSFRKAGDTDAADKVNTLIGQADSPFQTEAEFQTALNDPEVRAAIDRHKATVQPAARSAHQEAGGQLAGAGLNTGAFVNLKAIFEGGEEVLLGGGGRGNLQNPLRRPSKFSRSATGTAEKYETDYRTIAQRMIEGNFEETAKRKMYSQLVRDGLGVLADPGDPRPDISGKPAVKFQIERKGVPAGGGKARTYVKNLWVHPDIAGEVRNALNTDGPVQRSGIIQAANLLNRIQLAGPTDAVWHTANMIGSIAGSQGGRTLLADLGRKLPGVNLADAVTRTVASSIRVLRDSPEIQRQLGELGKIGAMREKITQPGIRGITHNIITLVDRAGRLVRDDMYKNLVRRGLVDDTEANRREWVNQMGQYNPRLMGQFQRFFKEAGFSPFIVAGRNFNRMAARRLTLDPGIAAASPAAAAQMRAVEFLGTAATLFAIPALFNYLITGTPAGRPGVKLGQIDTGKKDKEGKIIVIDPAQWTGLRRGLRISGLQALIEGTRNQKTHGKITQDVVRDVLGGVIHPWAGPAVTAGTVAATGYTPSLYKESDNPKDYGENLKAAAEQLNPLVKSAIKSWSTTPPTVAKRTVGVGTEIAKSLGGAVGVKSVPAVSPREQLGNVHQGWLESNKDPKVRADFQRNEEARFPVSKYRSLDKALHARDEESIAKAIAEIRPLVKKDSDILKRMRPYIGEGLETSRKPIFHESAALERKFVKSLKPEEKALYDRALKERQEEWLLFLKVWRQRGARATSPTSATP